MLCPDNDPDCYPNLMGYKFDQDPSCYFLFKKISSVVYAINSANEEADQSTVMK